MTDALYGQNDGEYVLAGYVPQHEYDHVLAENLALHEQLAQAIDEGERLARKVFDLKNQHQSELARLLKRLELMTELVVKHASQSPMFMLEVKE